MPDDAGLQLLQLRERVLQVARLLRAAGRVGLRIEVHDDALALEARQAHELAVLVLQRERRCLVADCELRHRCSPCVVLGRPVACRACADSRLSGSRRRPTRFAPRPSTHLGDDRARRSAPSASVSRTVALGDVGVDLDLAADGAGRDRRHLRASRAARHPVLPLGVPTARRGLAAARPAATRSRGCEPSSRAARPPAPPKPVVGLPTATFTPEQATHLATAAAAVAVVSFASALVGQLGGPISHTFHASDTTLSNALAITRLGALIALVGIALADRGGRRRSILIGVVGLGASSAGSRRSRRTSCSSPARRCSNARSSS